MSETTLPPFPVDDFTLDAIEHALDGAYRLIDGQWELRGADYSLWQFLDFLSGYDPTREVDVTPDEWEGFTIVNYPGAVYHPTDLIRALLVEIRRLRQPTEGD